MDYTQEFKVDNFKFWGGAEDTYKTIKEKGLVDEFQFHLESVFIDTIPSATKIKDYVWFDYQAIYEALGISEDE